MPFQRDIGIRFPSDTSQGGVASFSMTGRTVKRFIARGSRYTKPLHNRSSWAQAVGDNWFRNSLSLSDLSAPEPVNYARFIDARKTKIVDSIKERLLGGEYRAGIDTTLEVIEDNELVKSDSATRKSFPIQTTGVVHSNLNSQGRLIFYHGWEEVVWRADVLRWVKKVNGRSSENTNQRAIHGPSNGKLAMPFTAFGILTIVRSLFESGEKKWQAIFWNNFTGILFGEIVNVFNSGEFYRARSYEYSLEAINQPNVLRNLPNAQRVQANIGDPCIIVVVPSTTKDLHLLAFTEGYATVQCSNNPPLPLESGGQPTNVFNYVFGTRDDTNAIGQAI